MVGYLGCSLGEENYGSDCGLGWRSLIRSWGLKKEDVQSGIRETFEGRKSQREGRFAGCGAFAAGVFFDR